MNKKILINGYPRSGTSFIYLRILKKYPSRVLYEPLNPYIPLYVRLSETNPQELVRQVGVHPYFDTKKLQQFYSTYIENDLVPYLYDDDFPNADGSYHFLYETEALRAFLEKIKDYHIKEVSLHFYLDEDFITNNWEVYHIIRHPADTYLSILKRSSAVKRKLFKLSKLAIIGRFIREFLDVEVFNLLDEIFSLYTRTWDCLEYLIKNGYLSTKILKAYDPVKAAFVITWTISNKVALDKIEPDKLLVYNHPKTLEKFPIKLEGFKVKEYKYREKVLEELRKIAKKVRVVKAFDRLVDIIQNPRS